MVHRRMFTAFVAGAVVAAVAAASPAAFAGPSARPQPAPVSGLSHVGLHYSTSSNWSGYATYPSKPSKTKFTAVHGSWTQPSVTCSTGTQYAAFWVGLDGYNSSTVEQIGTDSDCVNGTATYYAWYEMYPAYPVDLPTGTYPVAPGDTITADVTYDPSSDMFVLDLADGTKWTYSTEQSSPTHPRLLSAEWIAEAPSSGSQVLPLADFGHVDFSGATATDDSGHTGAIDASYWSDDNIQLVSSTVTATPGALNDTAGGSSFTITVSSSGGGGGGGGGFCPPGLHKKGSC
jgi:hypothetical protein